MAAMPKIKALLQVIMSLAHDLRLVANLVNTVLKVETLAVRIYKPRLSLIHS